MSDIDYKPGFVSIEGDQLVDGRGEPLILRGVCLGGWMLMENFITGFPSTEEAHREVLLQVLGQARYDFFFDRFLTYYFEEEDARYLASLGLNLLRLPLNYRHFEDDLNPFVLKEAAFKYVDRVVELCARYGIYTVIDLHALPGYQNQDWHGDNPTHRALLWKHKHFQDRAVWLWENFARRYKDNPWVVGYNPINEPADPTEKMVGPFSKRLVEAIQSVDPRHLIFLDGNRYAQDFDMFGDPLPGVVYTMHHYPAAGFFDAGPYPGDTMGTYYDRAAVEDSFLRRGRYMREHHVPIWVGEFGPVYIGQEPDDQMRYQLLQDQIDIYTKHGVSWALWTYKDIGLQAIVSTAPDSPWITRLRPFLDKKARLGADFWGGTDRHIRPLLEPLEQTFRAEFASYDPFPFGPRWQIHRMVRHILLAEPLLAEFGSYFSDLSETELDELAQSFKFANCVERQPLAHILKQTSQVQLVK